MIKKNLYLFCLAIFAFGQYEVIPISSGLSEKTLERLWPTFKGGAISINKNEVIIPDKSSLFIQRRVAPFDYTIISLSEYRKNDFKVFKVTANKELFAYSVLGNDGRFYFFRRVRSTGETLGPKRRHGLNAGRLFLLANNNLVATGHYRPALTTYLDRYMKGSLEEQKRNSKDKFDPLYLNHKAYSVSVYDKDLTEIDSGNVIDRTGDNARAFEGLFLTLAVDMGKNENLYLIDNDQGYVVERYTNVTKFDTSFEIKNSKFRRLPDVMTLEIMHELKAKDRAYSVPYALYEKEGYLITCFFQAPVYRKPVEPPYYYDVSTDAGDPLHSGVLDYPILCEDDGDKVFFYVKQDGGWFEDDLHFLVGVTTEELLKGRVSKGSIDKSVESFKSSR